MRPIVETWSLQPWTLIAVKCAWGNQWLGFGIGLASLAAAIIALVLGHPATAGVIGGTTVVGLVAVFVTGRMAEE